MQELRILETCEAVAAWVRETRSRRDTIGLVPTMGGLHEGHYSLVRKSCEHDDRTLVTIFVNPLQFDDQRDLQAYPSTLEADLAGLRRCGANAVFVGREADLYPTHFQSYVEPQGTALPLEGESRSGHFRGVATVVLKLLLLCGATRAYFGEKDYQQLQVVRALVRDFHLESEIVGCATVREPDGLALSSRNRRLRGEERERALTLVRALQAVCATFARGVDRRAELERVMCEVLGRCPGLQIEYAAVADPGTLEPCPEPVPATGRALIAARLSRVRLIDNTALGEPPVAAREIFT